MKIIIDPVRVLIELAIIFQDFEGLNKIKNANGDLVIPFEKWDDFCHDMGRIVGSVLENGCKIVEE